MSGRRLTLLLPVLATLLAACATPPAAPGQGQGQMTIDSVAAGQSLAGTHCVVASGGKRWEVTTPVALPVALLEGDVRVVCDRPGFHRAEVLYRPGAAARPRVGVGIGGGSGNVGVGVGMGMPIGAPASAYPPYLAVQMTPR